MYVLWWERQVFAKIGRKIKNKNGGMVENRLVEEMELLKMKKEV